VVPHEPSYGIAIWSNVQ